MSAYYRVYIVTNSKKTVLYTGVTNNLPARLFEHWKNKGRDDSFAGKFYCFNLIYFETFQFVNDAIAREKEIKKWGRDKKIVLIEGFNPEWIFLNAVVCGKWPPKIAIRRK